MGQQGHVLAPAVGAAGDLSLLFCAGPLMCAFPLDEVVETMRPLRTRALAGTPPYVLGITILRGSPTVVVDLAHLLTGVRGEVERYVAVRAGRGPLACATGPVLGIQRIDTLPVDGPIALLTGAARRLIAGVGTHRTQPLLLLHSMSAVPDEVWEATTATEAVP